MKGGSSSLVGDLIIGVIGALLGGFLFRLLGISAAGLLGSLVTATVGAIVLIFLLREFRRDRVSRRHIRYRSVRTVSTR